MSPLQQFNNPGTNYLPVENTTIIQQTTADLAATVLDDILIAIDEETTTKKWEDWQSRHFLKEDQMRVADGTLTSTFIVPLRRISKGYSLIKGKVLDLITNSKEFDINKEDNEHIRAVQLEATELGNKLQTLCSQKEHARSKRFIGSILFVVFSIIAVVGVRDALSSSSRLVNKEDISTGIDASREKSELEKIQIERAQKDAKRLDALEHRIDNMEHNYAIDKFAQVLLLAAKNENRELELIANPESYNYEPSFFMERMASDILNSFSNKSDDLFDHVVGTGITEVMYFSTFNTIVLQGESANNCEDAHAMVVAKTIIPNRNVVGSPTQNPQKFKTQNGKFVYIAEAYIPEGSKFRPARSLSSQRLIMSSSNISVTVLNNTVFMIDNKGLHLDIVISCPDKPNTKETLYNAPFVRLHTSCEITSEHLNISSFSKDYIHDEIAVMLDIYDLTDEEKEFNIGYHRTPVDNKHDITRMFEMADDIFLKESEILQHEMKQLENNPSIWRLFQKLGNTVSGWFKNSLQTIVGVVALVVGAICGIMVLMFMFKSCKRCQKKRE